MIITEKILQDLSNKYQLEYNQFKFVTKKKFFDKKYFIYYSREEYFFQINKAKKDLGNFFPFFEKQMKLKILKLDKKYKSYRI